MKFEYLEIPFEISLDIWQWTLENRAAVYQGGVEHIHVFIFIYLYMYIYVYSSKTYVGFYMRSHNHGIGQDLEALRQRAYRDNCWFFGGFGP